MKKLNKPHVKNIRLVAPLGLLGVPPDAQNERTQIIKNATVIIVESGTEYRSRRDLPQ